MTRPPIDQDVEGLIQSFVDDLTNLIREQALQEVQRAIGGMATGAPSGRSRGGARKVARRTAGRSRKRGKRTAHDLEKTAADLYAYVKKNSGQRMEQIAKGMGVDSKQLSLPARKLLAEKKLRTRGQKRATSYFAR